MRRSPATLTVVLLLAGLLCVGAGCDVVERARQSVQTWQSSGSGNAPGPAGRLEPAGELQPAELREGAVVDGDTLRLVGFDKSVRVLCLDSEEALRGEELERAEADWEGYQEERKGDGPFTRSYGTFVGNEATTWAREFFEGRSEVFVEYASERHTRDFFGRHLAHIWAKDSAGKWINYGVEAVRAGWSPYATEYGHCDAYRAHFEEAQRQAQKAQRGIWRSGQRGYDDYPQRFEEWAPRARQISLFRERLADHPEVIELGTDTAMARLRLKLGERVVVFGSVDRYSPRGRPPKLYLRHRYREELMVQAPGPVRFSDMTKSDFEQREFVYVEGRVEMFRGEPIVVIDAGSFVRSGDDPPELSR
ncbi:thermonuclease family protein [Lujinxingia vulgaris]|uniref:Thermonuclease family protein n=1 Tax=Lujinxingia vulgaris TaxID=2600176 RepID=A0A5C6X500_9DELT|nr:thermonuclease family protein [Lujinxingia vulgaris]TXD35308.1 thermonuclease family protein [Lujinxingia vulgaris]